MAQMNALIKVGKKADIIPVQLSYQIIRHFSAGLYTSPNKAIEELVANSYDAWAQHVHVVIPDNLSAPDATIWVIDNGASMDVGGFKDLWRIGESNKREPGREDNERPPIGKFGIGKLATYVLARELTYVCKHGGKYRAVTMDFSKLEDNPERRAHSLRVRLLKRSDAEMALWPILQRDYKQRIALFGNNAARTWTVAAMSNLTKMAKKLSHGRLKRVLKTALPISPQFTLYYNDEKLQPVRIKEKTIQEWIIGKSDSVAEKLDFQTKRNTISIPQMGQISGTCQLFEKPLSVGKSQIWGRSHGFFIMVRGRLINLHDELFGLEALSHGAFSRFRMVVYADGLDDYLRATRETVLEDEDGVRNLRKYIKAKFNEARAKYDTWLTQRERDESVSRRISSTPRNLSRQPLLRAIRRLIDGDIDNLLLIRVPIHLKREEKEAILADLEEHIEDDDFFKEVSFEPLGVEQGLAIFDAEERHFKVNVLHPFYANYCEHPRSHEVFQFLAITEVLTEAYLLEANLSSEEARNILNRRDRFLRELVYSTQLAAPMVAQLLKESQTDPSGLEDAVYEGLKSLGFETTKMGGTGEPDGIAVAWLGVRSETGRRADYKLTYDSKSTGKKRIQANTALPPSIVRHKEKYDADYALVVAPGFEGQDKDDSAIAIDARRQKVTVISIDDFIRLVLTASTRPVGFGKLQGLFDNCHAPAETRQWVDDLAYEEVTHGPIKEILEVIFELQKESPDPVKFAAVRLRVSQKCKSWKSIRENEVLDWMNSVRRIAGPLITITNDVVSLEQPPERIIKEIGLQTSRLPEALRDRSIFSGIVEENSNAKINKKVKKKR